MTKRRTLTPEELERIKRQLLARKNELWEAVREALRHQVNEEYQDLIQTIRDQEDLAQADLQEDIVLEAIKSRKEELEAIAQAVWRIDNGEYGKCINCNKQIGAERLQARPHASYCLACKSEMERAEPKMPGSTTL